MQLGNKHLMCGLPSTSQAEIISPTNDDNKQIVRRPQKPPSYLFFVCRLFKNSRMFFSQINETGREHFWWAADRVREVREETNTVLCVIFSQTEMSAHQSQRHQKRKHTQTQEPCSDSTRQSA